MKKDMLYIIIAAVAILIIGVVAYLVMQDLGYFNNTGTATRMQVGGVALIPVLKFLWEKVMQLFFLLVSIAIGLIVLCGIGMLF